MKRAAIYARYSTEQQNESTLADQRRVCTERAQALGYGVVATFEDAGISGGATGNRPGFLAMREAAERDEFDALLVLDMSRLSRNQGDLAKAVEWLVFVGRRVIGVHDGVDTEREGWETVVGITGIIGHQFRTMIAAKTRAALTSRALQGKPTGGRAYGYACRDGTRTIIETQAAVVRRIFQRWIEGGSCQKIAEELNAEGIPSPGSTWNRQQRRCEGWAGSGIRAMLANPLYKGGLRWNTSKWTKNPHTGEVSRRERPKSEWIEDTDQSLQIVAPQVWEAAQRRTKSRANPAASLKRGGKARFILSGLLKCGVCGYNYTGWGAQHYACGRYSDGHACSNGLRMHRTRGEQLILGPVLAEVLDPERIERLARELQQEAHAAVRQMTERADAAPAGLRELDDRITRLRRRLAEGDPDLTADELQGAINAALVKRQALIDALPAAKASARILRMLPNAARRIRAALEAGLSGDDPVAAAEAREALRTRLLTDGEIRLVPEGGHLWAEYGLQLEVDAHTRRVPMKATGTYGAETEGKQGFRTDGSGGLIATISTAVVHFPNIDRRKIQREEIPSHCGRGHPLTPDNLRIDQSEQRWRCLQCGRERAAAFRRRRGRPA